MQPDTCFSKTTFPAMALNILDRILRRADNPAEMGSYLTEEVYELTGADCVLLIQCLCTPTQAKHRIVSVHPLQRRVWVESQADSFLYEAVHQMPKAQHWSGEETTDITGILQQEGFQQSMLFPLNVGSFRVGVMLVLGLPDDQEISATFSLLNNLSTIMALVLRNAILYEHQEQVIQERTTELRDNNQKLALELTERTRAEQELNRLNEELEQRVKERTKELEHRNNELEQMLKAFVGRELKMAALKERVKELEERPS
jgi:C4-dicarboxylate-specific signal transduction histidine kinase